MEYIVYKLDFPNGVHFGSGSLEESEQKCCADTLFSALYIESMKFGEDYSERLIEYIQNNKLLLSDMLPYIGDTLYVPRPMLEVDKKEQGNSTIKKALKKLNYIPWQNIKEYINGDMDINTEQKKLSKLGFSESRVMASIRGNDETMPYRIGVYHFREGNGLYILCGYEEREQRDLIEELLESLSYTGIGGKKNSGLGNFEGFRICKLTDSMKKRLESDGKVYMSLSVGLPSDDEIEGSIVDARYKLVKRSGFVSSDSYANEYQRKKDLYVFGAGSCFRNKFAGTIRDVSEYGNHKVYRYAKPLFMEVSV